MQAQLCAAERPVACHAGCCYPRPRCCCMRPCMAPQHPPPRTVCFHTLLPPKHPLGAPHMASLQATSCSTLRCPCHIALPPLRCNVLLWCFASPRTARMQCWWPRGAAQATPACLQRIECSHTPPLLPTDIVGWAVLPFWVPFAAGARWSPLTPSSITACSHSVTAPSVHGCPHGAPGPAAHCGEGVRA